MPTSDKQRTSPEPGPGPALDEFLNAKSNFSLQHIAAFWTEKPMPWHSKLQLIRELRKVMLDPPAVSRKLRKLGPKRCSLLRRLLKGDLAELEYPEDMMVIEYLSQTGFVERTTALESFTHPEMGPKAVPRELFPLIIDALDIDTRNLADISHLHGFLGTLPENERAALIAKWLDEKARDGSPATDHRLLLETGNIERRIRSLPRELRQGVEMAIDRYGGICGPRLTRKFQPGEIRKLIEERLIGTVTELPPLFENMDNPVVLIFTDVCEQLLMRDTDEEYPDIFIRDRGVASLADINTTLRHLSISGARVKRDGDLYSNSLRRLAGLLPEQKPACEFLARRYIGILQLLGLVREHGNMLTVTDKAEEWFARPPDEQLRMVMDHQEKALSPLAREAWRRLYVGASSLPLERTIPAENLVSLAILLMVKEAVADSSAAARIRSRESIDHFRDGVWGCISILEHYGIVRVFGPGNAIGAVRITPVGAAAYGKLVPENEAADQRVLIVNPDFECIVFRHGPAWRVAARLSAFARRSKTDQTYHFKITREDVQTAALCGVQAEDIVAFLRGHSRTPVPQNVEYSIRDWASGVKLARAAEAFVLDVSDEGALDAILADAELKGLVIRRIAPTTAIVSHKIASRKNTERLRTHGIFLRV